MQAVFLIHFFDHLIYHVFMALMMREDTGGQCFHSITNEILVGFELMLRKTEAGKHAVGTAGYIPECIQQSTVDIEKYCSIYHESAEKLRFKPLYCTIPGEWAGLKTRRNM
jgi:hypothetical protein